MTEYNFNKIWVSKVIESKFPFKIKNPILASIIKFGSIPNLIFIIFFLIRYDYITTKFLVGYIFALIWINFGPFLIWRYDNKLFPEFFHKTLDFIPDYEKLNILAKKYDNLFSKKFWIITVPWTILILYIYVNSLDILLREGGLLGMNDIFYWIGFICIFWITLLTSIGFWGVLITIFVIRDLSKKTFKIDPFHPDGLSGLSPVGYYSIGTTLLFSSGSLFLPLAFQLVSDKTLIQSFLDFAVFIFSIFILISFLYPTIKIHQRAKSIRDSILDKITKKYIELNNKLDVEDKKHTDKLKNFLELYRLRNEYMDYKKVKLYPLEIEIFIKLISSIILPFIFLVIEVYWFNLLNIV